VGSVRYYGLPRLCYGFAIFRMGGVLALCQSSATPQHRNTEGGALLLLCLSLNNYVHRLGAGHGDYPVL